MDIFNSVKATYAQAAAATKPVVKTVTAETQTEITWPDGSKQPRKYAVEQQTTKVTKTSSSSQTSASQNGPIKLKISQSKVEESPITNSQGRSGNKNVNNGTKKK